MWTPDEPRMNRWNEQRFYAAPAGAWLTCYGLFAIHMSPRWGLAYVVMGCSLYTCRPRGLWVFAPRSREQIE